ncbi:MAG: aminopeptidase [Lachnospiraceae bacterium]|nr:aminopeptidase [Lachnospiraceae bacterium]
MDNLLEERLKLAKERIFGMENEEMHPSFSDYFKAGAAWFCRLFETEEWIEKGSLKKRSLSELEDLNRAYYEELYPENYNNSYANPAYAVEQLGEDFGQLLSAVYAELRQALISVYTDRHEEFAAAAELFLEIAAAFRCAWEEEEGLPAYEDIRQIFYWYMSDYADIRSERQIYEKVTPREDRIFKLVTECDLTDLRYLYLYGNSVSENELKTAAFLNSLPEETIRLMADTFTEGYRIGFIVGNKDISIKKSVSIHYNLGFERVVRKAVENFAGMGLATVLSAETCQSTPVNRQYLYDHKDDNMLFFDRQYMNRKLETIKYAFEQNKEAARKYGGPAVMEVFGEEPFAPTSKEEAIKTNEKYQKLMVEYISAFRQIQAEYIKEEERSFTIIAFPTPAIGEPFAEIFSEIIHINTLDYKLYQQIQQTLIDTLDKAEYVEIKGMNGNRTDLKIMLRPLLNPEKETKFENCVADVNIPVGEVFTSPVLKGTQGTLHVSKVFLNELEYKDLEIILEDGMVADYSCGNFSDKEEGRRYIRDNVLYHHDTLPIGEFAIGTNTTAYMAAQKYDIGAKLPILIAEKMGPHFALGDTCYSQAEEVKVYNPDGKEIIARDNEISALRNTDRSKAYYNCHTDITIPYHELGELTAVGEDGTRYVIIREGRFVLDGCEELNKPLLKEI